MAAKLDEPQGRGDFFKALGGLLGGFIASRVEEAVTGLGPSLLRPPGAVDEVLFLATCTRCDKCLIACPEHAILRASSGSALAMGTPYLLPRSLPCFLCPDLPCVRACPEGALVWPSLNGVDGPRAVRMGTARIRENRCLTWATEEASSSASCRTCVDRCPFSGEAIRLSAAEDGVSHPEVFEAACTGCGLCAFACPVPEGAIVIEPRR